MYLHKPVCLCVYIRKRLCGPHTLQVCKLWILMFIMSTIRILNPVWYTLFCRFLVLFWQVIFLKRNWIFFLYNDVFVKYTNVHVIFQSFFITYFVPSLCNTVICPLPVIFVQFVRCLINIFSSFGIFSNSK